MKTLLIVLLLVVLGGAAFLYRTKLENPLHGTNTATQPATACALDAKICPDGSSVGRTGPSCDFAACPLPNIELPQAGLGYVLPNGYKVAQTSTSDTELLGSYEKLTLSGSSTVPDTISVHRYTIPAGKDANSVMLSNTTYSSSGMQPTSMQSFTPVIINGKTYQMIVIGRFEGTVQVAYYLPRGNDVLRFDALQNNVTNWTDPSLDPRSLQTVSDLETMLGTLQSNEPNAS